VTLSSLNRHAVAGLADVGFSKARRIDLASLNRSECERDIWNMEN
jgi:hypothetical protein